jgi:pimeloyl-ACP methyl ester carboxylesterase
MFLARWYWIFLCVLAIGSQAPALAGPPQIVGVDDLNIYGATVRFARDSDVPGGAVVWVAPPTQPGEDWSVGTGVSVPVTLKAGERLNGFFWARAEQPLKLTVTIHGPAPDYKNLAIATVEVTTDWQRFAIAGVAASNLPAGSQSLSIGLGRVQRSVVLGPVMFVAGQPDDPRVTKAFAAFEPRSVAEDAQIASDPGVTLAGRLRVPTTRGRGPVPAVLLLSGSGPGLRGGFHLLEERLLNSGIAVLTYDKRGNGQSTGQFVDTLANMTTDARAAVRFLRSRTDIDGARIALAGHSQGGAVGPAVAAQDPSIAAVVMFAGPVAGSPPPEPGHEINLVILKEMLLKTGADPAAVARVAAAVEQLSEVEIRGGSPKEVEPLREKAIQAFMRCNFNRQLAEGALAKTMSIILEAFSTHFDRTLASLRMPVLALYGSRDVIVPSADNMPAAKKALAANPDAQVIEIADMDHGFHHGQNASAQEQAYPGPIAAPEVITLAGDWLDAHLHPADHR